MTVKAYRKQSVTESTARLPTEKKPDRFIEPTINGSQELPEKRSTIVVETLQAVIPHDLQPKKNGHVTLKVAEEAHKLVFNKKMLNKHILPCLAVDGPDAGKPVTCRVLSNENYVPEMTFSAKMVAPGYYDSLILPPRSFGKW